MAHPFDPYREALVVEQRTVWPPTLGSFSVQEQQELAQRLHENPAACAQLEYVRLHTGFCRKITVTQDDLTRLHSDGN